MQQTIDAYSKAMNYQVAEVTTEATYQIAEIYHDFAKSLMNSQRPKGLDEEQLEEYELLLEEQAFPFEEKAIDIHLANFKRIPAGTYDEPTKKSLKGTGRTDAVSFRQGRKRRCLCRNSISAFWLLLLARCSRPSCPNGAGRPRPKPVARGQPETAETRSGRQHRSTEDGPPEPEPEPVDFNQQFYRRSRGRAEKRQNRAGDRTAGRGQQATRRTNPSSSPTWGSPISSCKNSTSPSRLFSRRSNAIMTTRSRTTISVSCNATRDSSRRR